MSVALTCSPLLCMTAVVVAAVAIGAAYYLYLRLQKQESRMDSLLTKLDQDFQDIGQEFNVIYGKLQDIDMCSSQVVAGLQKLSSECCKQKEQSCDKQKEQCDKPEVCKQQSCDKQKEQCSVQCQEVCKQKGQCDKSEQCSAQCQEVCKQQSCDKQQSSEEPVAAEDVSKPSSTA